MSLTGFIPKGAAVAALRDNNVTGRIVALFAIFAMVMTTMLMGASSAIADTGGSGGGDGGSGGGGGSDDLAKVYLDVYDHVAVQVDPITGQRPAGQGWGQDSIDFFINRADAKLQLAPREAGTGNNGYGSGRWNSWSGSHQFSNGKTLEEMIQYQCTQAIDEAVSRNAQATSARVVSLQFSFAVDGGNMGDWFNPDWYYFIRPTFVHYPHWRDTVDEVGNTYASKKIGSWSNQNGQLEADGDGDGNYTNGEYINAQDLDPSAQPTAAILAELDRAVEMAWDVAQPNTHYSSARMVSCVAMNDREPEGLVPNPVIDVSKNAEDIDGVVEHVNLPSAGSETVTTVFTNTGDEDLNSLTFADNTTSGNQVKWTSITLPNGSTVAVGGTGTPADVQNALAGVVLAAGDPETDTPGGSVSVTGTVQVDAGTLHVDRVTVTGTGDISGQVVSDNDATEYSAPESVCTGSIGDVVWEDTNRNGIQDAGEAGVDGVTVKLLDSDGGVVDTTTTSGGGNYLFAEIECGTYSVEFTAPEGYEGFTDPNQGDDDGVDSDADKTTGKTGQVTIDSNNPSNLTLDAGLVKEEIVEPTCFGSIGDLVWEDTNRNGIQDAGEAGVGSVTVKLLDSDGDVVDTTTTDANGNYLFEDVVCGTYSVQFTAPDGYEGFTDPNQGDQSDYDSDADKTTGKTGQVTIDSEMPNSRTLDAGLVKEEIVEPTCFGSIGDLVWEDANKNGVQDAGEAGVDGVTVKLLDSDGGVVDTTTTSGGGNYLFAEIECGTYSVQFTAPAGYEGFTGPNQGEDGSSDSDADKTTGKTGQVTIDSEMPNNRTLDAGLVKADQVEPPVITPEIPAQPQPSKVPNKLPSTGSSVSLAVGLTGILMLAAGGGLLIARRRMQAN